MSKLYFGRYGNVLKVVFNSSPGLQKNSVVQAYVTYEKKLSASIAIVVKENINIGP